MTADAMPATPGRTALPPGIYGLDDALVTVRHQAVTISAARSLDDLLRVLKASQWRVIQLFPAPLNLSLMRLADCSALLRLRGGDTFAEATITPAVAVPLHLSGAETASGTARFLPLALGIDLSATADDPVSVQGTYDGPGDLHVMLSFDVRRVLGEQNVSFEDESNPAVVYRGSQTLLETIAAAVASQTDPDPDSYQTYSAPASGGGTAVVTSLDPFVGTVHLTGLEDDKGYTLDVEAGFSLVLPAWMIGTADGTAG